MTTAYLTDQSFIEHRLPGYNHPENPNRLLETWEILDNSKVTERLKIIKPTPVTREMLRAVHEESMIARLERIPQENRLTLIDQDTYALPVSWEIAKLSAGAVVKAVDSVVKGHISNAFTASRPPGHHATPSRSMGFCLVNNVAIAARYAVDQLGLERVMIMDYDVHHGNGTQDIFYDDNRVLFISTHQYPFYPSSGSLKETGVGKGMGYTINIPLPNSHGDKSYKQIFEQIIWKAARRYKPQLIIVSAGFDGHFQDPLGQMRLTNTGYAHLTRELIAMAKELCDGKIVFAMEGGYDVVALGHGMLNIAYALLGEDKISDPYGEAGGKDPDPNSVIEQVLKLHNL
jgi:acetoin utilization deacetylase AcuC-like enzyme